MKGTQLVEEGKVRGAYLDTVRLDSDEAMRMLEMTVGKESIARRTSARWTFW